MADFNPAPRALPERANLEQLKKQARELLDQVRSGDRPASARVRAFHPRLRGKRGLDAAAFALSDAQLVIAREYGFASWPKLKNHLDGLTRTAGSATVESMSAMPHSVPVIAMRDLVVFPETHVVLHVGRTRSLAALNAARERGEAVLCVAQRDAACQLPGRADVYDVGTLARIEPLNVRSGTGLKVLGHGQQRVRIVAWHDDVDHARAEIEPLAGAASSEVERLGQVLRLHAALERVARVTERLSSVQLAMLAEEQSLGELIAAGAGCCPLAERQRWLEQLDGACVVAELCQALTSLTARHDDDAGAAPAHTSPAPASVPTPPRAQLVVLFSSASPHLRGRRFTLDAARTRLGRSDDSDIALHSDAVSRHHACIERSGEDFVLADEGSTNGTFVDGSDDAITRHLLRDGDRFMLGDTILGFLADPDLEAKYQAALDRMTSHDMLTDLLNGVTFRARLDRAVLHARGADEPLSLLIADVHDLPEHIRNHGPLSEHGIARWVAQGLRDLPDSAILGRYTGDQFAAALPSVSQAAADQLADHLRNSLARRALEVAGERLAVQVAVGAATLQRTSDLDQLFDDALAALQRDRHRRAGDANAGS